MTQHLFVSAIALTSASMSIKDLSATLVCTVVGESDIDIKWKKGDSDVGDSDEGVMLLSQTAYSDYSRASTLRG